MRLKHLPFQFEAPLSFFEKADAGAGKHKLIGGVTSTETPDKQQEIVLQRGLDFQPFLEGGWFNDNHTKDTDGILGYPEKVKQFRKGDQLPDGAVAKANGTWAEGYLLETEKAKRIWELAPHLGKAMGAMGEAVYVQTSLPVREREVARMRIAQLHECHV